MSHPDFRVGQQIFATLSYPDENWGMVKLTPEVQRLYIAKDAATFIPARGAWGVKGSTLVRLETANQTDVEEAVTIAWRPLASQTPTRKERAR